MEENSFVTTLFMFIVGIGFIIFSLIIVSFCLIIPVEKAYIKNKGIQIEAKVISKSWDYLDEHPHYNYRIEYVVFNQTYSYYFESNKNDYNENDIITIYCLYNNPEKVSVAIEKNNVEFLNYFFAVNILLFLGIMSVKNYNIFKYKRIIEVK